MGGAEVCVVEERHGQALLRNFFLGNKAGYKKHVEQLRKNV